MKKNNILKIILTAFAVLSLTACKNKKVEANVEVSDMKNIAELSTMECYYHTVAKYDQDIKNPWFMPWRKDIKRFWIEYSGVVTMGIDVSLVEIKVSGENVKITIPEAKVFNAKVDPSSLDKKFFYKDKNSASITAEDERKAFTSAQKYMIEEASKDKTLLTDAKQRAKDLLEGYINGMGNIIGKKYSIQWIEISNEKK